MTTAGRRLTHRLVVALYPYMANRTTSVGSERHITIMTGSAIFTFVKGSHGEVIILFSNTSFHFEEVVMATVTLQSLVYMILMFENNGLDRFGKDEGLGGVIFVILPETLPAKNEHHQDQGKDGSHEVSFCSQRAFFAVGFRGQDWC